MTTTQSNISSSLTSQGAHGIGTCVAFDQINEPGAYVCNWSGHLIRLPDDAVMPGRSPVLEIKAREQLYVTKISDDPFVALTKARMIAGDLDRFVDF